MIGADGCGADAAEGIEQAECFSCPTKLDRPFAQIKIAGVLVPVCSTACIDLAVETEREHFSCEHCGAPTIEDDRLKTNARGFAHAGCALKATVALGLEKASMLVRRRVQGGIRS